MRTYSIMLEIDPEDQYIKSFPFGKRWLRGEEFGFLCRHYYAYSHLEDLFQIVEGNHPEEIYHEPVRKYFSFLIQFLSFSILQWDNFTSSTACTCSSLGFQDAHMNKRSQSCRLLYQANTRSSNGRRQTSKQVSQNITPSSSTLQPTQKTFQRSNV